MKGIIFWVIVIILILIMKAIAEFLASIITIELIVNTFSIITVISIIYLFKELK